MSILGVLFSLLLLISNSLCEPEICSENNGNILILHSIVLNNSFYLFTLNGKTINQHIVDHFEWDGNSLNLSKVQKTSPLFGGVILRKYLPKVILILVVDYPGLGLSALSIAVSTEILKSLFFCQKIELKDQNGLIPKIFDLNKLVIKDAKITLKTDQKECNSDPLMLCSIFQNYPQNSLQTKNFLSFVSFPPTIDGLPSRYFVYYKKSLQCVGCYETNRHLFIRQTINSTNNKSGFSYVPDNKPDDETDLKGLIVNASTAISDYQKNQNNYYFDLIEFFGQSFRIYRVYVTIDRVMKDMDLMKNGTISSLFCRQTKSTPTPTPEYSTTETVSESVSKTDGITSEIVEKSDTTTIVNIWANFTPFENETQFKPTLKRRKASIPIWVIILNIAIILFLIAIALASFWSLGLIWCNPKQTPSKPAAQTPTPLPIPPPTVPPKESVSSDTKSVRSNGLTDENNLEIKTPDVENEAKTMTNKSDSTPNTDSTELSQTST